MAAPTADDTESLAMVAKKEIEEFIWNHLVRIRCYDGKVTPDCKDKGPVRKSRRVIKEQNHNDDRKRQDTCCSTYNLPQPPV